MEQKGIKEKKNNIHIKKIIYINREQNIYIKQKVSQIKKKNKIKDREKVLISCLMFVSSRQHKLSGHKKQPF